MKLMRKKQPTKTQSTKKEQASVVMQNNNKGRGILHRLIVDFPIAAVDRVTHWKSVFFLIVLFSLLIGVTVLYVTYGVDAQLYIAENEQFALPNNAIQIAYFSILGVIAQKLSMLEQDARNPEKDLIIYSADVLGSGVYAPLICICIIFLMSVLYIRWGNTDLGIGSSDPGFISIISLLLGFQHERLRVVLNRAYRKLFEGKGPKDFECPYASDEENDKSR